MADRLQNLRQMRPEALGFKMQLGALLASQQGVN
jgi:hypothetical protein